MSERFLTQRIVEADCRRWEGCGAIWSFGEFAMLLHVTKFGREDLAVFDKDRTDGFVQRFVERMHDSRREFQIAEAVWKL